MEAWPFLPKEPVVKLKDLIVGKETNAGRAAAALAHGIRASTDPDAVISLRAMGAEAIHQALTASCLAQKYLDNESLGIKLALVPCFEEYRPEHHPDRPLMRQLVLRIFQ